MYDVLIVYSIWQSLVQPGAFDGLVASLHNSFLSVGHPKKNSLFVIVKVVGKIFLHSFRQNIPHSDQCLYNESVTNANTNTNRITNANSDRLVTNPFFCYCYGFSIVAFVNAFIDALITIMTCDFSYLYDDDGTIAELNRQKAGAIATIIDVINVIKKHDFKIVAYRYIGLVPALIDIVDDRLEWVEDVQRGEILIETKPIAMKILCEFVAYFSYENNPNYDKNMISSVKELLINDRDMRNMRAVDERDAQYICNKIQLYSGGYYPECKTQITRYLVRKGIIGCICDMLWKNTSSNNEDDDANTRYVMLINQHLSLDMVRSLHTIMSFGEKYLKFVSYAYGLEYISGPWFDNINTNNITNSDDDGAYTVAQVHNLKQSLQMRLDQAIQLDFEDDVASCKWYNPVTFDFSYHSF